NPMGGVGGHSLAHLSAEQRGPPARGRSRCRLLWPARALSRHYRFRLGLWTVCKGLNHQLAPVHHGRHFAWRDIRYLSGASESSRVLGLALWSANAGMKALMDALNVVYEEKEKRGFIKLNLVSLAFTAGAIVSLLLALGTVVVLPLVLG